MRKSLMLAGIAVLGGCTTRIVDFTVISTKNVDWSQASSLQRAPSRVEGIDMVHIIIFIPTGQPNMKEAVDRAIEKVPGAVALVDGVVYSKGWYIPYIYGRSWFAVEGTPLVQSNRTAGAPLPAYWVAKVGRGGDLDRMSSVTREAYESLRDRVIPTGR
ncbi:MAG TPA: hypothetical protein VKA21_11535 [Candidatus Binatia bacterium]|nr:hypothetical protein [Candidatus Binatia bacterium]